MEAEIAEPRGEISPHAPRILTIQIPVDKIREVIGPGGKVIRGLVEKTGCKIDVEDTGRINIASSNLEKAEACNRAIEQITAVPELSKPYLANIHPTTTLSPLCHILP